MFEKAFIIEHDKDDIELLKVPLKVVLDEVRIIVIRRIDEALARIKDEVTHPDLTYIAFIDILWKERVAKGIDLAKAIKKRYSNIKLVAFTGIGEKGAVDEYVGLFDAFIDKTTASPFRGAVTIPGVSFDFLIAVSNGTYKHPLSSPMVQSEKQRNGTRDVGDVQVVVVSALDEELDFLYEFPFSWSEPIYQNDGVTYRVGSLGEGMNILASCAGTMGLTATAILTAKVLKEWKPRIAAMIGVCGGRKSRGLKLGDIVVANQCFHYQFGAFRDGKIERELRVENTDTKVLDVVQHLIRRTSITQEIQNETPLAPRGYKKPKTVLECHVGPMASADLVVKDIEKLGDALEADRKTIAVDMESYAFMKAARLSQTRTFFSIKSVVDFADAKKDDEYREYAKFTSARFCHTVVSKLLAN
jgi:nucleoside phosphorylase